MLSAALSVGAGGADLPASTRVRAKRTPLLRGAPERIPRCHRQFGRTPRDRNKWRSVSQR
eukprot:6290956-Alexandrium_andersonii.AAC.1